MKDFFLYFNFKKQCVFWILTNFIDSLITVIIITKKINSTLGFELKKLDYIIYFLFTFFIVSLLSLPMVFVFRIFSVFFKKNRNILMLNFVYLLVLNILITLFYYLFFNNDNGYSIIYIVFNIVGLFSLNCTFHVLHNKSIKITNSDKPH